MTTNSFNQARGLAAVQQSAQPDVKTRLASQEFRRTAGQAGSSPIQVTGGAFSPVTWPPFMSSFLESTSEEDRKSAYGHVLVVRDFRRAHVKVKPSVEATYRVLGYMSLHDTTPDILASMVVGAGVLTTVVNIEVSGYAFIGVERKATGGVAGEDEILGFLQG